MLRRVTFVEAVNDSPTADTDFGHRSGGDSPATEIDLGRCSTRTTIRQISPGGHAIQQPGSVLARRDRHAGARSVGCARCVRQCGPDTSGHGCRRRFVETMVHVTVDPSMIRNRDQRISDR
jgi:hypothetical protein